MSTKQGEVPTAANTNPPPPKKRERKEEKNVNMAVYLSLLRCFRCHVFYSPLPSDQSEIKTD